MYLKSILSRVGLAAVIAVTPYVVSMNKAEAQEGEAYPYTIYVESDCSEYEPNTCFDNVRDAVDFGMGSLGALLPTPQNPNIREGKYVDIQIGPGEFQHTVESLIDRKIVIRYPTRILGTGNLDDGLESILYDTPFEVLDGSNATFENLDLRGNGSSIDPYNDYSINPNPGANVSITGSRLSEDAVIKMTADSNVLIEGNEFNPSGSKTSYLPPIVIVPSPLGKEDSTANLQLYGNTFNSTSPAIYVRAPVSLEYSDERPEGLNTFTDVNPVLEYAPTAGEFPFALVGDSYIDTGKSTDNSVIRGSFIKYKNGVRKLDAKDVLEYYKENAEDYSPTTGVAIVDPTELQSRVIGVNAALTEFVDPLYFNPSEVSPRTLPGYEGMTNLEHYNATGGSAGGGVIGTNSGYGNFGYSGLRTLEDVDGDERLNAYDIAPYNPNVPEMILSDEENGVPASSGLGLAGLLGAIGLGGAYVLRRKDKQHYLSRDDSTST